MAYSALGLTPDCGVSWLLPRAIGGQRALEFALRGRAISAEEALPWGLVTRVADDPLAKARELVSALASGPSSALGQARRLLRNSWSATRAEAGADETDTIATAVGDDYAQAALAKFLPNATSER